MIRNYFKIAWRNLFKHKIYTIINVLGLALGICSCLVIHLITQYEFSFDTFHQDKERIYRVVGELQNSSGSKEFLNCVTPEVAGIQKQIPGFEVVSGFHTFGAKVTISFDNKPPKNFNGNIEGGHNAASIITGPEFFQIFQYEWLEGNSATLREPFKVVLSESSAHKYFGNIPLEKVIGKTVIYQDSLQVTVSGIVKDWNQNTDFGYTDFISISTATHSFLKNQIPTEDWYSLTPHRSQAFVKLARGISPAKINANLASYVSKHVKLNDQSSKLSLWVQPINDIHFTPDFHRGDDGDDFRKAYLPILYILMGIALFILIIAAVNFINLSTAQSVQRAKEIGIRKVLGSKRSGLVFQLLMETLVLTILAVIFSMLLVKPVLSAFSEYVPEGLQFNPFNTKTIFFLVLVTVVTSLLAGFYPATVISSYLPVLSLKGGWVQKGKGNLRKGLIVFQFTISLVFIIGAIVVDNQIHYMQKADKGFKTDAIVILNTVWRDRSGKPKVLSEKIKQIPGIQKVILEATAPMGFAHNRGGIEYRDKEDLKFEVSTPFGNEEFIPFYQMKIVAGRNMIHSDSLKELVINETCCRKLGFASPEDAIGKSVTWMGNGKTYPIVGVLADYHEGTFHENIGPVAISHMPEFENGIALKIASKGMQPEQAKVILSKVEKEWKNIYPEEPFGYNLLNDSISRLYNQENNTAHLMNMATFITIFISCMGLFGLGMFTAEKRTKEIGIRKVLGASVGSIAAMLSLDFIRLVLLAIFIASPIAWYFMNKWLQDFVYRSSISWWIFVLGAVAAIIIALLTISFQAMKAAFANPVKSLRTE